MLSHSLTAAKRNAKKNAFPAHGSLVPPSSTPVRKNLRDFILKNWRFAHSFTWDGSWMDEASQKVIGAWECLTSRKQSERSWRCGNWTGNMESNPSRLGEEEEEVMNLYCNLKGGV